jgi:hypothetical protein
MNQDPLAANDLPPHERADRDAVATIALQAAGQAQPPEPPHETQTTAPPRRWLARALRFLAFGLCLALAGAMQWRGLGWTASATSWLDGAARTGGLPENGAVATLWHKATTIGLTLGQAASLWQFCVAGALLSALLVVAWRLRGAVVAILALALFLLWPTTRGLLDTIGAEAPLATLLLTVALAGLVAWPRPLVAATLLGLSLAGLVLVHPLGLPLAIVALLVIPVLPLRDQTANDEALPGVEPGEGLWPQAVTLAHVAGIALAIGVVAAAYGPGGFKIAWMHLIGEWRAPVVTPWLGGITSWPLLGPLVAFAAQVPVPLLVLAGAATVSAVRRPADPSALPVGLGFGAWLALTWLGLPTPGYVDAVALLAPGIVLLAAVMIVDVGRELLARGTAGARTGGLVLAVATLLALLGDLRLAAPDRRNLLAHIPGVMTDAVGAQPAVLRPAELGLLYQKPLATTILPSHLGGNALASALRALHPPLQGLNFGAAFSTDQVLVATTPGVSVEAMWTHIGKRLACTEDGRTCLIRIRGK